MFHTSSKHSHVCLLWFQGSLFPGMLKNKQTWPFGFILYIIYIYNNFFIYLSAKKSPQIQLFLLCITPSKHGSWPKNHNQPPHFKKNTCFSGKKGFQHITSIAATDLIRSILSQWFPVATGTLTQKQGHCQATDRLICLRQKRFQWRRSPKVVRGQTQCKCSGLFCEGHPRQSCCSIHLILDVLHLAFKFGLAFNFVCLSLSCVFCLLLVTGEERMNQSSLHFFPKQAEEHPYAKRLSGLLEEYAKKKRCWLWSGSNYGSRWVSHVRN